MQFAREDCRVDYYFGRSGWVNGTVKSRMRSVINFALKTYTVMYRFRKAGNFVQVEVRAPNNTPVKHIW